MKRFLCWEFDYSNWKGFQCGRSRWILEVMMWTWSCFMRLLGVKLTFRRRNFGKKSNEFCSGKDESLAGEEWTFWKAIYQVDREGETMIGSPTALIGVGDLSERGWIFSCVSLLSRPGTLQPDQRLTERTPGGKQEYMQGLPPSISLWNRSLRRWQSQWTGERRLGWFRGIGSSINLTCLEPPWNTGLLQRNRSGIWWFPKFRSAIGDTPRYFTTRQSLNPKEARGDLNVWVLRRTRASLVSSFSLAFTSAMEISRPLEQSRQSS